MAVHTPFNPSFWQSQVPVDNGFLFAEAEVREEQRNLEALMPVILEDGFGEVVEIHEAPEDQAFAEATPTEMLDETSIAFRFDQFLKEISKITIQSENPFLQTLGYRISNLPELSNAMTEKDINTSLYWLFDGLPEEITAKELSQFQEFSRAQAEFLDQCNFTEADILVSAQSTPTLGYNL